MPLLNYTTKVDVYTTLGAIQGQLVKHGAKKIMQDYDGEGNISALSFLIDTPAGPRGIRLPADAGGLENRQRLGGSSNGDSGKRNGADGRDFLAVHD